MYLCILLFSVEGISTWNEWTTCACTDPGELRLREKECHREGERGGVTCSQLYGNESQSCDNHVCPGT